MIVTNSTDKGRVFISKYEIKKTADEIISSVSNKFKFIEIKVDSMQINLLLKALDDYNEKDLELIRNEIISAYKTRYDYEVLEFNIEIL